MNPENMDADNIPAATAITSKEGTVVIVQHDSAHCYFRPETEELVFVTANEVSRFENHWREMALLMNNFHQANTHYSSVLEHYARAAAKIILSPIETEANLKAASEAEVKLEKTREDLKKKLGDFSTKDMSYDDVVELIPLKGNGAQNKKGRKRTPYAYVKKGYFSQNQQEVKLHTVSLKSSDKKGATDSIYTKDTNGRTRIDTQKLTQQLEKKLPILKLELKDVLKWLGTDYDPEKDLQEDKVLFDWAQRWNDSLLDKEEKKGDVDVSSGAQFMRYVANVGGSAEYDPTTQQTAIKGEAKASLTLASGFVSRELFAPDRMGWALTMKTDAGQTFDLGLLRLRAEAELNGFLGASVQLEGQLQVVKAGEKQMLAGQPGGRLPRFQKRRATGLEFHQAMKAQDEGLQLTDEAFVGLRIEGGLTGALQWMKPTPPPGHPDAPPTITTTAGDFTDFCKVNYGITRMTGIGAGSKFHCTFINGRFCFSVAASLCWGTGARGAFSAEVDAGMIVEFGTWLIYQLYSLDYGFFKIVDHRAFAAYSQYCVMQMDKMGEKIYQSYEELVKTPDAVALKFEEFLNVIMDKSKKGMEASKIRNQLAKNIINFKQNLLLYTPETKGILLYLLTRHSKMDHIDRDNRSLLIDIYRDRKEAIICVLTSVQTVAEWKKVMCRITKDGSNLTGDSSQAEVVKAQEEHLVRFLQEGYNRDKDMDEARRKLTTVYHRLKRTVALGYALAMNDTYFYQLNELSNPHYPQRCQFGPCGVESEKLA